MRSSSMPAVEARQLLSTVETRRIPGMTEVTACLERQNRKAISREDSFTTPQQFDGILTVDASPDQARTEPI